MTGKLEVKLLETISEEPFKQKTYYILKLSGNQEGQRRIRKLIEKLVELGIVEEVKDGSARRLRLTYVGRKYLMSLKEG